MTKSSFHKKIYNHYKNEKRILPWRSTSNPYKIAVSEIMLQQTQAHRVIPKYKEFIRKFPTVSSLARASIPEILSVWQGLGYNRRALMLHAMAMEIVEKYKGKFPMKYEDILSLRGIGPYTAGAISVFAYNRPSVMIETNIRTVFIYFFFSDSKKVSDKELLPLIEKYQDEINPREWYNALMDYGVMLKRTLPNPSRRSTHHSVQSKFKGSNRQVRGAILKVYSSNPTITKAEILKIVPYEKSVVNAQYKALEAEGFFV